ncbi:MAG: flagellar biosynthesis protein FlhF [Spongiibacteraceae bacterium]
MKSFVATDMRSALRLVREEFGDDAVILSNRRVPQGIEIVAAADMPPPPPPMPEERVESRANENEFVNVETRASEADRRRNGGENAWYQMQQELRSMRDLIEQQYTNFTWQQYRAQKPAQAAMWRRLQRLGLDADVVRELLDDSTKGVASSAPTGKNANDAWQALMMKLSARIPVCESDLIEQGGIFAFVGPTGAGKTTTIGKLAARYVLDHGNSDIALITTDSYRIGAHEQLRTLARILNVPCKIVSGQRDLASVLYEVRHCKVVLIDSAGLNARAPELRQQLAALDALGERVQVVQVLAANSQQQVLSNALRAYRTKNLSACILTKLDEACSLGECISLLIANQLPLAYVADGQAIPGDLAIGNGKALVSRAIALAKNNEGNEEQIAQAFVQQNQRAISA